MKCPYCMEDSQDGAIRCKHCKAELALTAQSNTSTAKSSPVLQQVGGVNSWVIPFGVVAENIILLLMLYIP